MRIMDCHKGETDPPFLYVEEEGWFLGIRLLELL
jgi:hypothetical protein